MKKIIASVCALVMTIGMSVGIVGCDDVITPEKIELAARSIGLAAGYAVDMSKMSDKDRNVVIQVVDTVSAVVPVGTQSFTEVWTPAVAKLLDEKGLNDSAKMLITSAMSIAIQGLDYMFDVRWPKAREYEGCVSAGVHGFAYGFKTVISPEPTVAASVDDEKEFNAAKAWLTANLKK